MLYSFTQKILKTALLILVAFNYAALSGCIATCSNDSLYCPSNAVGTEAEQIRLEEDEVAQDLLTEQQKITETKQNTGNMHSARNLDQQLPNSKQAGRVTALKTPYSGAGAKNMANTNKFSNATKYKEKGSLKATDTDNFLVKPGTTNIYLFRGKSFEPGVPTYVSLNGKNQGNTVPNSYFKWNVVPGKYQVSAFGSNIAQITIETELGKNYFIQQEVIIGTTGPIIRLHLVEDNSGKDGVLSCKLLNNSDNMANNG